MTRSPAHCALEDRLPEEHGVDPLGQDLDAVLGQHPVAVDQQVAGHDEVRGDPPGVAHGEPRQAGQDQAPRRHLQHDTSVPKASSPPSTTAPSSLNSGSLKNRSGGGGRRPPRCRSAASSGTARGQRIPGASGQSGHPVPSTPAQLGEAVVVDAEVVGDLVHDLVVTCSTTSSSVRHMAQIGSRKMVMRSGMVAAPCRTTSRGR